MGNKNYKREVIVGFKTTDKIQLFFYDEYEYDDFIKQITEPSDPFIKDMEGNVNCIIKKDEIVYVMIKHHDEPVANIADLPKVSNAYHEVH